MTRNDATAPTDELRALELFAGYGGLALAVEAALGARPVALAEYDPAKSRILDARFPGVPNLRDVTTARWADAGDVDVIGGGSPCTDISVCGRRREGMITGNRSGLWASMRDAVADRRPRFVVWENVRGALTSKASSANDPDGTAGHLRAIGRVLGDLSSLGYDAEWILVKASDVGACHRRARVFLLAWDRAQVPAGLATDYDPFAFWDEEADIFRQAPDGLFGDTDPFVDRFPVAGAMRDGELFDRPAATPAVADDVPVLRTPTATVGMGGALSARRARELNSEYRISSQVIDLTHPGYLDGEHDGPLTFAGPTKFVPTVTASDHTGPRPSRDGGPDLRTIAGTRLVNGWGDYLPAIQRHAVRFGDPVPPPTEPGAKEGNRPRLSPAFAEWMMGLPAGWVTDPALNLSRVDQLRSLGDGVVPAQAAYALRLMLERAAITV